MSTTTRHYTKPPTPDEYWAMYLRLRRRPNDAIAREQLELALLPVEAAKFAKHAEQRWNETPMSQAHHRAVLAAAIRPASVRKEAA